MIKSTAFSLLFCSDLCSLAYASSPYIGAEVLQLNTALFYDHASKIRVGQSNGGKLGIVQQGQACSQLCTEVWNLSSAEKQVV